MAGINVCQAIDRGSCAV